MQAHGQTDTHTHGHTDNYVYIKRLLKNFVFNNVQSLRKCQQHYQAEYSLRIRPSRQEIPLLSWN